MKTKIICLLVFFLLFGIYYPMFSQYRIEKSVFGSGIVKISNENYIIKGTIGQVLIGETESENSTMISGFWYSVMYVTDVSDETVTPWKFELSQNYPNPFNPVTTIKYELAEEVPVRLKIYNLLGEEIETLINEPQAAGSHNIEWDGSNFSSGLYLYTIRCGENFKAGIEIAE